MTNQMALTRLLWFHWVMSHSLLCWREGDEDLDIFSPRVFDLLHLPLGGSLGVLREQAQRLSQKHTARMILP